MGINSYIAKPYSFLDKTELILKFKFTLKPTRVIY